MATSSGGGGGSQKPGGRRGNAGGRKPQSGRRARSKPVIIDLEADAVKKPEPVAAASSKAGDPSSSSNEPKAASAKAASGEAPKVASAKPSAPEAKKEAPEKETSASAADKVASQKPSSPTASDEIKVTASTSADATAAPDKQPSVPTGDEPASIAPEVADAAKAKSGPGAFFLFAAGLIGGLLALALLFLASTLGLISLPSGQADDQRAALLATEERLAARIAALEEAEGSAVDLSGLEDSLSTVNGELTTLTERVTALEAGSGTGDAGTVDVDQIVGEAVRPLEQRLADLEGLRDRVSALEDVATGVSAPGDGAPALTLDALVADALRPFDERLTELADTVAALSSAPPGAGGEVPAELDATLSSLQGQLDELSSLAASVTALSDQVDAMAAAEPAMPAEATARLDALEGVTGQLNADVEALSGRLSAELAGLGEQLTVLSEDMSALAEAPANPSPDALARIGLALDGLERAISSGQPLAGALSALQSAAEPVSELASLASPLSNIDGSRALDDAALVGGFEAVAEDMLALAPADDPSLIEEVEERLFGLITIRTPGAEVDPGESVAAQIEYIGVLVAGGDYSGALAFMNDLPPDIRDAAASLTSLLSDRTTVDAAISGIRDGLTAALTGDAG